MLATGRSGAGKTVLGLQFLGQGLKTGERSLLLSVKPAEDVALFAAAFGVPVDQAVEKGDLIILEYSEFVPGRDREDQLKLPSDSFLQLKQIIEEQSVQRVVLDTVLPWVSLKDEKSLPEHIFSLVRVFHRLGTTTLFTLPRPISTAAIKLRRLIEDVVPVSVSLNYSPDGSQLQWQINKYLGTNPATEMVDYEIVENLGIVRKGNVPRPESKTPRFAAHETQPPRSAPPRNEQPVPRKSERAKPSFSDLIRMDGNPSIRVPPTPHGGTPTQTESGWNSITGGPRKEND